MGICGEGKGRDEGSSGCWFQELWRGGSTGFQGASSVGGREEVGCLESGRWGLW